MIAMNYLDKQYATKNVLRDYRRMERVIEITPDEIKAAYEAMVNPRTPTLSQTPAAHNPLAGENRLAAAIDDADILRERYRAAVEYMEWFEPAWQALTDEERLVLTEFYMMGSFRSGANRRLREKYDYSERSIERLRSNAFDAITALLYGR